MARRSICLLVAVLVFAALLPQVSAILPQVSAICTSNCPDGYGCIDSTKCLSGSCVNNICCVAGKTCCSGPSDSRCPSGYSCGAQFYCVQKKTNGASCAADNECSSGSCKNGLCCDPMKACCTSSAQCGKNMLCSSGECKWACETKPGGCCSSDKDCPSGSRCAKYAATEFQWGECTAAAPPQPSQYCGDGSCSGGETCSSCTADCGECQRKEWKVGAGHSCGSDSWCEEGLWCNWFLPGEMDESGTGICCERGKGCCDGPFDRVVAIGTGTLGKCNQDYTFTVIDTPPAKRASGKTCSSESDCESGLWCNWQVPGELDSVSGKGICCERGKGCCQTPGNDEFSLGSERGVGICNSDYTVTVIGKTVETTKKTEGQPCSSSSECESGWCDDYGIGNKENCKIKKGELFGGCENARCCEYGKKCCSEDGGCIALAGADHRCNARYFCEEKAAVCGDKACQRSEKCHTCASDCACDTDECCVSQFYAGGYSATSQDGCAAHGEVVRSFEESGERNFCAHGKITMEAWGTCVFDSHCKGNERVKKYLSEKYGRSVDDSEIVCAWKETYGMCDKKPSQVSMVGSVEPAGDSEAEEIRKLIEEDIYPSIIEIFEGPKATGSVRRQGVILLRMTDKETVASWDESAKVMTVPYRRLYENFGSFSSKTMQLNGIAHELTHYHFNGLALKAGGDFKRIPLWFREGIAEYGAHAYYKSHLKGEVQWSISESRANIFVNHLATNPKLYKETVQGDAIKKVSWKSEDDWDKSINQHSHVYYGAAFSFIDYFLSRNNDTSMDNLKYVFVKSSREQFRFYSLDGKAMAEQDIKKEWFDALDTRHKIRESLQSEPPGLVRRFFSGIAALLRRLF